MKKCMSIFIVLCFSLIFLPQPSSASGHIQAGEVLADTALQAPKIQEEKEYLGIGEEEEFRLKELDAEYFIIEVVGAYCPVCHAQSSEINQLFNRIHKDKQLSSRLLMFSVVSGATDMEIEHLKSTWNAPYPMLADYEYDFLKAIGNPDVPFTLIVSRDGKVHYSHLGKVPELSEFMEIIRGVVE
ncbi:MAG: peroxiredoxin family protein [Desulfonatronovibrio sp.]